ncbi:NitT/TauT family transport system substrate-binding protein [Caulobacter ginsengisoli]|uniref:NitT/TauT family transport system substrate-binding protein n=1 Tax=Caulobacter ginsengisoli TaxID=400775 RepID=A0ABU0INC7_9CAUL|nr:ABC transporter substrate-binding protein [Caulobacter ginsengisoli]MDQ0463506.1 NitT/TauT family transport system substrate-binding protein [Caulobacter ginsengisoli]
MPSRRLMIAGAAAALAAACAPAAKKDKTPTGRTQLRFATDWRAQGEHGGFYQALATGEYAKRGLDVQIIQGGPNVSIPTLLSNNAVEMGMGSNDFVVLNMALEKRPVKTVAAFFQKDVQVLIAHPDVGIKTIADMKGHPMLLSGESRTGIWVWLKAKYGFTDDQLRPYNFSTGPFLADKSVVQQGYLSSEPYTIEKEAGLKPAVFLLADNGYPSYGTMAMASQAFIDKSPDAVRAFVEASAIGWKSYLHDDTKAADALIMKDNPEMTPDLLAHARQLMRDYGIVESGDAAKGGVGVMTDARWEAFFQMASGQGVYPKDLDYKAAYTLEFLPKAPA